MTIYMGDVEVFAYGKWHTVRATLWGGRDEHADETSWRERWGGSLAMNDARDAQEVYDDGCKLRLPNGEERTFSPYSFAPLMNINGDGSIPFG
ncbi:hypothetical protein [Streptomyces sp. AK02-04a]|uniref:hypothetical protein n=1 Tax=Streptomyces sp. AK02-04a TaxID=3028649 RepID=UPI0029A1AB0C|nr:hypothetical protein [Streptomyces sp. AK02-04a]MDX3764031.1 hypothetical protein [Streptomyces sp. AK02-04a]